MAEKGVAQAQYNLGVMYEKGKGVKQNHRKAKKWFSLAADQGLIQAQTTLASMYHEGEGVLINQEAAIVSGIILPQNRGMLMPNISWG